MQNSPLSFKSRRKVWNSEGGGANINLVGIIKIKLINLPKPGRLNAPCPPTPNSVSPATFPECMGVNELWFLYNVSFFVLCLIFFFSFSQADCYGEIQSLTSCITIVRPTSGELMCKLNSKLAVTKLPVYLHLFKQKTIKRSYTNVDSKLSLVSSIQRPPHHETSCPRWSN